jgi:pantoate--beta-alanine ligase
VSGQRLRPMRCATAAELEVALAAARSSGEAIAFVPTMGALHRGHLDLVMRAADLAPTVVVSIFVNPTQFDVATDLAAYPRTLDEDLAALASVPGTSRLLVYTPDVTDIYPDGPTTTLHIPDVTEHLCGASRPGHFDGVATVVDALLRLVRPTVALFGRKDHQQFVVVRHLVIQQRHDVRIVAVPTVREDDGLALSSRNALLAADARRSARRIPQALAAGVGVARRARRDDMALVPAEVLAAVHHVLADADADPDPDPVVGAAAGPSVDATVGRLEVDYVALVDPDRISPVTGPQAPDMPLLLAVAVHARSGERRVRLIDNVLLGDLDDEGRLLHAVAGRARR